MSTFDKLTKIHSSMGVYRITEGSNIGNELRAYSAGLDILADALEELQRECFITTAESYGIRRRELMFGAVREDLPVETRRNMLLTRYSFGSDDFTPEGINKILKLLGIEALVQEFPSVNRVTIDVITTGLTKGQRNWIRSQIAELFPAHLEMDVIFDGFSWDYSDNQNLTFDEMEGFGKTWLDIDYYII